MQEFILSDEAFHDESMMDQLLFALDMEFDADSSTSSISSKSPTWPGGDGDAVSATSSVSSTSTRKTWVYEVTPNQPPRQHNVSTSSPDKRSDHTTTRTTKIVQNVALQVFKDSNVSGPEAQVLTNFVSMHKHFAGCAQ